MVFQLRLVRIFEGNGDLRAGNGVAEYCIREAFSLFSRTEAAVTAGKDLQNLAFYFGVIYFFRG